MAKLGPESLRRISSNQPFSGDLPRTRISKGLLCPGDGAHAAIGWQTVFNDTFCPYIEE
jgi:hypothetical protein